MNLFQTKVSRGEVYYIKSFPTCGHEQHSGRPAVIVSNNDNNNHGFTYEIVYLTLQEKKPLPTHIKITSGPCINSTVLCEQVTTVTSDRLGDYMCRVPDDILDAIDEALMCSLGIPERRPMGDSEVAQRAKDLENQLTALKCDFDSLYKESKILQEKLAEAENAAMYKNMYNELIDRLILKGAK